jgi:CheY-like chemotaxis protein
MNILIAEDNLEHQKITEYVLKKNRVSAKYFVVRDGQEVLDYLYRNNGYSDTEKFPMPNLILLDLNLPKRDGREVLKLLKEDPTLKNIPVVIVSTSDREEDINYATQMGIVGYISKSIGFDKFSDALGSVVRYARQ